MMKKKRKPYTSTVRVERMVQVGFQLPVSLLAQARDAAARKHIPMSQWFRRLVERHFEAVTGEQNVPAAVGETP